MSQISKIGLIATRKSKGEKLNKTFIPPSTFLLFNDLFKVPLLSVMRRMMIRKKTFQKIDSRYILTQKISLMKEKAECILNVLFRQIKSFRRFRLTSVFGLQTI